MKHVFICSILSPTLSRYWERRRRNNESAKRSREIRRAKELQTSKRIMYLEQENVKLQAEVSFLREELNRIRDHELLSYFPRRVKQWYSFLVAIESCHIRHSLSLPSGIKSHHLVNFYYNLYNIIYNHNNNNHHHHNRINWYSCDIGAFQDGFKKKRRTKGRERERERLLENVKCLCVNLIHLHNKTL